jgi:AcrR family transcriptional regulator
MSNRGQRGKIVGRVGRRALEDAVRSPGRPAGASGDETRQRILAKALETFAQQGFAGSSVRDIARRARIRVASLYHYFPSKDALYREVQDEVDANVRGTMFSVLGQGGDFREMTRAAIGELFDFCLANRAFVQVGFRNKLEEGWLGFDPRVMDRWMGLMEGLMKPAAMQGRIKDVDPGLLVVTVDGLVHWHTLNDAMYRQLFGKGIEDPEVAGRVREHVIQVVLRTLGLE